MKKKLSILFVFLFILLVNCSNVLAYNNYNGNKTVSCNGIELSYGLVNIFYYVILIIQIATPVTLVIVGMTDLIKGMTSNKEDDIKKGQQVFIRRLVIGAMVFLVIMIVKMVLNVVSTKTVIDCVNCFVNGAKAC